MERKNLCPGLSSKKDEDNEKKNGRISLKKRKRVVDDKDENNLWRVKCGTKMGILHKEKMSKGEACIERKGSFYTPPEFEKLAGKEPCRKWKSSICHKGKTLRFWFKKGYLTTTGYRQKKRKQQSSDLESHELSTEPKEDRDEDEDDDGEEDDDDMDEDNEPDTKKNKDEDATPIYISSEEEESEKDLVEDEDEDMDEDDVGDDQRSTEEDEDEEDDNDEEETVPAVASNNTDSKERVTATIPTPGKHALEMKEKTRRRPDMPRSEVSGNKRDVAKNTAIKLQNVKKEPQDKLSLSCEPLAVSDQQEHKAVHCSGHKVADLQPMRPEGGADMMEALSPKPSGSSGLNTVDLDELKREEIKMQLTVLKLKEEYYTLKIKELKK